MNAKLYKMLKSGAEADLAKADLTMELLSDRAVGIGDHSTGDFYKNAEEALSMAADAMDRLEALKRYEDTR
jgi:hypothetical protein|tara:strand:- start:69 stop:281 length:213 start_codon:yes stop_codon:yes gene_type:complete